MRLFPRLFPGPLSVVALLVRGATGSRAARAPFLALICTTLLLGGRVQAANPLLEARRVVFLGDSITYAGEWVEFVEAALRIANPAHTFDFINLGLPSETVSGLSEPGHAGGTFPRPDLHERLDRVLARAKPDLLVVCYGMNDGIYYPLAEDRFARFRDGMIRLREKAANAGARVIHVTPPTFDPVPLKGRTLPAGLEEYRSPFEGYNQVLARYSAWLMEQRTQGWQVVDIHTPMDRLLETARRTNPAFVLAGDGVHAGTQGHWLIARELLRQLGEKSTLLEATDPSALTEGHARGGELLQRVQQRQRLLKDAWLTQTGHTRPGMAKGKPFVEAEQAGEELAREIAAVLSPFPGKRSSWFGFDRYDFDSNGQTVTVVAPRLEAPGRPWAWHGEFFGHKPNPDIALLGRGFHVVYLSAPDLLGSPQAVAHWNRLYAELQGRFHLAPKVALVGLSRGGLYCYNWAIANADKVACIYGDAPVCDFRSWPGAFGKGKRSDRDWQLVMKLHGFKTDEEARAYDRNPVDALAPLAAARVPLLHVYGDADEVVPWDENTGVIASRYRALGGSIELIAKPGVKHHPHGLEDSTPIVEFIWKHTASPEAKQWLARRGGGPADEQGRPFIRKLGTIDLDLVETTPVVFRGKPMRFEWVRHGIGQQYWANTRNTNYFRFRDPATGKVTGPFADGHEFGSAFVHGDTMVVTGTLGRGQVNLFLSRDLETWEQRTAIPAGKYGIFNTSLCRADNWFVLMFEIDKPKEEAGVAFTARFTTSPDLVAWTMTAPECNYTRERYSAPHCLRFQDGWFYNFYLEAHRGYEMRVVRSRDLIQWTPSPLNPVLRFDSRDRLIANPAIPPEQQKRVATATNINNSDIDFCEWQGRMIIHYSWGNQQGTEHLAEAVYDGTERQFLLGWFPE